MTSDIDAGQLTPGQFFLAALHNYLGVARDTLPTQAVARETLNTAFHSVDWSAVHFALQALDDGKTLCAKSYDHLDEYEPPGEFPLQQDTLPF